MHNPLVSTLIPVYNREKLVGQAIESALAQTFTDFEIVVVDNNSEDGTWDVCQRYAALDSRVRIFRNDSNIGPVGNWRRCMELARGMFGKLLFSDDMMMPDYLRETVPLLQMPDVSLVFTAVRIAPNPLAEASSSYLYGATGKHSSAAFIEDALLDRGVPVSPGCAIFRLEDMRRNLIANIDSPFLSDFPDHGAGPDLLLFLLTASRYPMIGYVDKPLCFFRAHENSISISMRRLDLWERYQQARLWFAERYCTDATLRCLMAESWLQRLSITRHWVDLNFIGRRFGVKACARVNASEIFKLGIRRIAKKIGRALKLNGLTIS